MPNILYPPPRPQSVGEILDSAFRIFGATLLKCLPYSFLAVIVGHLTTMYDLASGHPIVPTTLRARQTHDPLWWTLFVVAIFATVTLTNAVLLRQYALATGRAAATGTELSTGARRVPGVLLIAILMTLAVVAIFIPLFLVAAIMSIGSSTAPSPAVIWAIGIALIIVLYVLSGVIGAVVALLLAHGDVAVVTATGAVVVTLLGAVVTPFYSALVLAVFGDVSVRREGADRSEEHTSELQSQSNLVCRLLLEKKKPTRARNSARFLNTPAAQNTA